MIVKGVKISELMHRDKLTGEEMIPFQDQLENGKLNMKGIIDYFQGITDQELSLQSLVNIKKHIHNANELQYIHSNVGDVYFCTDDKKLYVYVGEGKYESSDPSSTQLYVMLTPIENGKDNALYRWDKTTQTFILPSYVDDVIEVYATYDVSPIGELTNIKLYEDEQHIKAVKGETGKIYVNITTGQPAYQFRWSGSLWVPVNDGGPLIIGEIEGTAYDGGKGAHNREVLDSLPDTFLCNVDAEVRKTADTNMVDYQKYQRKEDGTYEQIAKDYFTLRTATDTEAGLLTAADKKYVDSIPTDIITSKVNQVNPTANDVTLVHSVSRKQDGVHAPAGNLSITINAATSTLAGVMAAKDKEELDRINSANFEVDEITATESVIQIATSKTVVEDGSVEQDTLTIPTSTADKAGVQSAADKKLFDSIPEVHFTESGNIIPAADKVTISHSISRVTDGIYQPAGNLRKDIPAATQELAGVMTAADKVKLDVTLPNQIAQEVQDRKDAISALETSSNAAIQKETQDRMAADEALDTKLQSNIDALESKHDTFVATKGKANGFASLDENGLVPSSQLPAYVDDVIEVVTFDDLPETGEEGKIYVTLDTNLTYRWSGSQYIEISSSLALGETSSTAYPGDKGKANRDALNAMPSAVMRYIDSITANDAQVTIPFRYVSKNDSNNQYETDKNASVTISSATTSTAGVMSGADKTKLDKVLTDGDGSKYLADNGTYKTIEIVEDTTETVKTTTEIPVAGGPLANLLNDAGITTISPDTSVQDLLMSLFTKEMWPTNISFKEGKISAFMSAPTFSLNKSGLVEVGTVVTVSDIKIGSSSPSTSHRQYSGLTYGYSIADDDTKDSSDDTIIVFAKDIISAGSEYTLSRKIANQTAVEADPNTDPTQVTLPSITFNAIEGDNNVVVETTGTEYSCKFAEMPVYYACSNLGKTDANHKTEAKIEVTKTSNKPSNTKTLKVTGVYPYFTNKDNITAFTKLPLTTNKTLDVTFVAETSTTKHAFKIPSKFSVNKITLLNTLSGNYETYDVSKFTITTENIDVQGTEVEYKVYTRNDGTNGSSSFKITFA